MMPAKARIMIVEDEAITAKVIQKQLSQLGYEVAAVFASGEEAVAQVQAIKPHLILMDIQLAGDLDGIETASQIHSLADIPVIYLTANADEATLSRAKITVPYGYIVKPFDSRDLKISLDMVLSKHTADRAIKDAKDTITQQKELLQAAHQELELLYEQRQHEYKLAQEVFARAISADYREHPNIKCLASAMETVGGDILLFAPSLSGNLYVLLGDFTGHGLSAAIGVVPLSDIFYKAVEDDRHLPDLVAAINKKLKAVLPTGLFLCVGLIELNSTFDQATIWNGGLPEIFIVSGQGEIRHKVPSQHLPLGVDDQINCQGQVLNVLQGDRIYLYSDGLTEATNTAGEMFGQERLEELLIASSAPELIMDDVLNSIATFRQDSKQADDFIIAEIICEAQLARNYQPSDHESKVIQEQRLRQQAEEAQVQLEAQLRQAQKLEAIGTLAGGIAHDFNNILSAIMGFTELSLMEASPENKVSEYLQHILQSSNRAQDLVKQILTFSRQGEQQMKPVQLHLLVKETLKMLRASLPATIEICHNLRDDGLAMADPTQIHQILMNLGTNAAHAMGEKGGILEVGIEEINLESLDIDLAMKPGSYWKLTVSDSGHGIDPTIMNKIFDPFFSTKGPSEGTGLGLAVVHGIVQKHGGSIKVYSETGKGTTFQVFIPKLVTTLPTAPMKTKPIPRGQERILLVDDEPLLAKAGELMLKSLGYQVVSRRSSREALELLRTQPHDFDLIITDLTMPHLTGLDFSREIRLIRSELPIILCTGFSANISEGTITGLGINGILKKPIILRDLAESVRKVLDSGKGLPGGEAHDKI